MYVRAYVGERHKVQHFLKRVSTSQSVTSIQAGRKKPSLFAIFFFLYRQESQFFIFLDALFMKSLSLCVSRGRWGMESTRLRGYLTNQTDKRKKKKHSSGQTEYRLAVLHRSAY